MGTRVLVGGRQYGNPGSAGYHVRKGEGIIEKMREMLGVTDCRAAAEGSIRAELGSKEEGKSKMCNIAHASDSPEAAEAEIARFFKADEVFSY